MPGEEKVRAVTAMIQQETGIRGLGDLAHRVVDMLEGKWSDGGPDHDGLTGKPFRDREDRLEGTPFGRRSRVKTGSFGTDQLNSLAEKLMIALGDSTTMDTLTGDPGVLVDRIIAERDDLRTTVAHTADELIRVNDELTQAHAEVKRLRGQPRITPVHEVEIMHERTHGDGAEVRIKCPYPECSFDMTLAGPVATDVHDMVPALAEAHRTDMEVKDEPEG